MWVEWERWRYKKELNEIIDMKNKIFEVRSLLDWINGRLYFVEEDIVVEINYNEV